MSPTEVARETVKGLSSSPVLLIIAVLNVIMILGVGYAANNAREERRELRQSEDAIVNKVTEMCTGRHQP